MADLGYDPRFLDTDLAPPQAPGPRPGEDPAVATPLDYAHFTVRMHPERRLAWWVAWNVDGLRLFPGDSISRSGERFPTRDCWRVVTKVGVMQPRCEVS